MARHDFSMDHYWMPFTPNRHFKQVPRVFVAADGMYYTTHDGRRVLDATSGLWCMMAGHNRKPINEAIKAQLDTLDYAPPFMAATDQVFRAAQRVAEMAPGDLNHVFFVNSGSEACDTAMKIALAYHRARGEGHRNVFVGRERGYHGVGFGGISVGGIASNRKVFGTSLLPRVDHMRHTYLPDQHAYTNGTLPENGAELADELEQRIIPLHDASNIAAVIVEPVAGSTGWLVPPKGYLQRLRDICDRHGILLIFDEVIVGFGRLGTNFGADYFGVVPDMLNFAKGVTNGVIPMGGVIAREHLHEALMKGPEHVVEFFHGYTYSGHPVAAAAALATLDLYKQENLFARAADMGKLLGDAAFSLKGHPNVVSIRALGCAAAIEVAPMKGLPGKRAYEIFLDCFSKGVWVRCAGDVLVLAPSFIVEKEQIATMVAVLGDAIRRHAAG